MSGAGGCLTCSGLHANLLFHALILFFPVRTHFPNELLQFEIRPHLTHPYSLFLKVFCGNDVHDRFVGGHDVLLPDVFAANLRSRREPEHSRPRAWVLVCPMSVPRTPSHAQSRINGKTFVGHWALPQRCFVTLFYPDGRVWLGRELRILLSVKCQTLMCSHLSGVIVQWFNLWRFLTCVTSVTHVSSFSGLPVLLRPSLLLTVLLAALAEAAIFLASVAAVLTLLVQAHLGSSNWTGLPRLRRLAPYSASHASQRLPHRPFLFSRFLGPFPGCVLVTGVRRAVFVFFSLGAEINRCCSTNFCFTDPSGVINLLSFLVAIWMSLALLNGCLGPILTFLTWS